MVNLEIVEVQVFYSKADCALKETCQYKFSVPYKMTGPVYVYYELTNFYQSHRRYTMSKSAQQLAGNSASNSSIEADCSPMVTNEDMQKTHSWKGVPLNPKDIASPCGLIAASLFNGIWSSVGFFKERFPEMEQTLSK